MAFPTKEEVAKRMNVLNVLANTLTKRYDECNSQGHKKANGKDCNYCYRPQKFEAPQVDAILAERQKLHWMDQPMDAPVMMERRRSEISVQETLSYTSGLEKLEEELKKSGELEKLLAKPL